MPARVRAHRVLLTLAALTIPTALGFAVYGFGRAWTFLPSTDRMLLALGFFGVIPMFFFIAWLVCAWEAGWFGLLAIRRRRVRRGRCWRCQYPQGNPSADICSECGSSPTAVPTTRCPRTSTIVAVLLLGCSASTLGALIAEWHLTAEDQRFMAYVQSMGGQHNAYRDRAWPFQGFGFVYLPGHGFSIND